MTLSSFHNLGATFNQALALDTNNDAIGDGDQLDETLAYTQATLPPADSTVYLDEIAVSRK